METKGLFQFEITINVLVFSLHLDKMSWAYYYLTFSARGSTIDVRILTSKVGLALTGLIRCWYNVGPASHLVNVSCYSHLALGMLKLREFLGEYSIKYVYANQENKGLFSI